MKRMTRSLLPTVLLLASMVSASDRPRLIQSVDVHVPVAPATFSVAGKRQLVYELQVGNFQRDDVVLRELVVVADDNRQALARFEGAAFDAIVGRPGNTDDASRSTLAGGSHAVLFLWLTLPENQAPPRVLHHTLTFDVLREANTVRGTLDDITVEVSEDAAPLLSPPLRGGPWAALYDPHMDRGHRTSIYTLDGRARIPARFAIDWVRLHDDGSTARGDASKVRNWHGFGEDVLAVADATVAMARDDMAEADDLDAARGPMPLETASGNYVALDLGDGRFAFYEHLQHGSVQVRPGDRVVRGQVIARLGNSGSSSSGPHLHFHVADASATLAAEGLPYVFSRFDEVGRFDSMASFGRGEHWISTPAAVERRGEMPAPHSVVVFEDD